MTREMKDSGIEWIGKIPREWEVCRGKYLFSERNERGNAVKLQLLSPTQKYGVIPQESYDKLSGQKAVKLDESIDLSLLKTVNVGDFCISLRSFQGGFEYSKYNGVVSLAYHIFHKSKDIDDGYFRFLFKETGFIKKMASLTKTFRDGKSISFTDFANSLLPVPPRIEQQRISVFLEKCCARIDSIVERVKTTIESYRGLKQTVITEAVTKGIRSDRPMKDSGVAWIGEIPEDWNLIRLQFLIDRIESGTSVNAGQQAKQEGEIGVLKTSCVSKNVFLPLENKAVNTDEYNRVSCPVMADTLIVSRMNTPELVGACGYVERDYPDLFLPDRLWQVHFIPGTNVKYIHYWIICRKIRNYYASLAVGTSSSMQNISQDQFYHAKCPTPPQDEQQEIVTFLDAKCAEIDALISSKQRLLAELEAYKKSVIYEYVTGKKEVPVCP